MAKPIKMPDLGTTVDEFLIIGWHVTEGDTVTLGDVLADIETDKAVTELESTADGVVIKIVIDQGEYAHVGDILAYIGVAGETIEEAGPAPGQAAEAMAAPPPMPIPTPMQVSPVVRNVAKKLGVDLATIQGSGVNGQITHDDVLRAAEASTPSAASAERSRCQAAVARAVAQSWSEIPHTYFTVAIDMTAAQQVRAQSKADGAAITYDAMLLSAMAQAVKAMPVFSACVDGERLIQADGIHLALALDIDDALLMPVVREADTLTLQQLQVEIALLVSQMQTKSVPQSRLSGGCMALSNLGMYTLEAFSPIIFPGHTAILAVGRIHATPVVVEGEVVIRPVMQATLAVDHRVINGRTAAAFLQHMQVYMEHGVSEALR